MANLDSADCLARMRTYTGRPTSDADLTDARAYTFLSDAQLAITREVAAQCPAALYAAPELMTTSDSGVTYVVAGDALGHMKVYPALGVAEPLIEGAWEDPSADYTREGPRTIRMVGNRPRATAPYARYVKLPSVVASGTEPTLKFDELKLAMIYRACGDWAQRGGTRDPAFYRVQERELLYGDPVRGTVGFIAALKSQYTEAPSGSGGAPWWIGFGR